MKVHKHGERAGRTMGELSRKDREKAEHRLQILRAAEEVFAEEGFHGATMQDIASRAEFSVGYLYGHFESKEGIFQRLVDLRAAEFIDGVQESIRADGEPLEKVRGVIAAKLDFFRRRQRFFLIFTHALTEQRAPGHPPLSQETHRRYGQYLTDLAAVFAEGVRRRVFVAQDPMTMAVCVEGITNATIGHWVETGGAEGGAAPTEVIQRLFLNGVLAEAGER